MWPEPPPMSVLVVVAAAELMEPWRTYGRCDHLDKLYQTLRDHDRAAVLVSWLDNYIVFDVCTGNNS